MKKIIVLLSILIILTGCSGSKQEAEPKTDEPATTDVDALSADDLYHLGLEALKTKEYDKALDYLLKSVEAGGTLAYYDLGLMYYNGEGVEVDGVRSPHSQI